MHAHASLSAAHVWAEPNRLLDKVGPRMPVEHSCIAATARRNGLTIATGNDRDFKRPGLKVFNPFNVRSPFVRYRDSIAAAPGTA